MKESYLSTEMFGDDSVCVNINSVNSHIIMYLT
jgi:hypothetical protein